MKDHDIICCGIRAISILIIVNTEEWVISVCETFWNLFTLCGNSNKFASRHWFRKFEGGWLARFKLKLYQHYFYAKWVPAWEQDCMLHQIIWWSWPYPWQSIDTLGRTPYNLFNTRCILNVCFLVQQIQRHFRLTDVAR